MRRVVVREGIEFLIEERPLYFNIYTPHFSSIAPVMVYKPERDRLAEMNWVSVGNASIEQAREVGNALLVGTDIATSLNRGHTN